LCDFVFVFGSFYFFFETSDGKSPFSRRALDREQLGARDALYQMQMQQQQQWEQQSMCCCFFVAFHETKTLMTILFAF
jgi:hypothetical protein